jgi:hypothetical protein
MKDPSAKKDGECRMPLRIEVVEEEEEEEEEEEKRKKKKKNNASYVQDG